MSRVTFDSGSSLALDTSGGDFSLDSASTTLPVTIFGPGTVTLTGANSFGGVTIDAGSTLGLGDGTTDGSLAADVTDNGTLVFDTQGNITFDGNICGYGGVIENGPGTLTLAGSNTYSGGTTVAADSGGTLVFPTGGTSSSGTAGNVTVTDTSDSLPTTGILTIGSGTEVVLGTPPGENGGDGQTSNLGGGRLSDSGGSETTPTDVVELYLQPISYGTTNYTTNFEADSNDAILTNTVTTSDASGTIYFDVYAGLNQGDSTHADDGVQSAELNFTSTGTIGDGSSPSSLGLTLENGFQAGPVASSGSVADLNGDGNLDLGSTNNRSGTGWADFCQNTNVYAAGTGDAAGAGDRTNIFLGVVAYTYANATDGQTAQVTLDSRAGTVTPVFGYELDGVKKFDSFFGTRAGDLAIGTPVTITYAPPETQDMGMSVGAAFVSSVSPNGVVASSPSVASVAAATPSLLVVTSPAAGGMVSVVPAGVPMAAPAAIASPLPADGALLSATVEQARAHDVVLQSRHAAASEIGTLSDLGAAHDRGRHHSARKGDAPEELADAALASLLCVDG